MSAPFLVDCDDRLFVSDLGKVVWTLASIDSYTGQVPGAWLGLKPLQSIVEPQRDGLIARHSRHEMQVRERKRKFDCGEIRRVACFVGHDVPGDVAASVATDR